MVLFITVWFILELFLATILLAWQYFSALYALEHVSPRRDSARSSRKWTQVGQCAEGSCGKELLAVGCSGLRELLGPLVVIVYYLIVCSEVSGSVKLGWYI